MRLVRVDKWMTFILTKFQFMMYVIWCLIVHLTLDLLSSLCLDFYWICIFLDWGCSHGAFWWGSEGWQHYHQLQCECSKLTGVLGGVYQRIEVKDLGPRLWAYFQRVDLFQEAQLVRKLWGVHTSYLESSRLVSLHNSAPMGFAMSMHLRVTQCLVTFFKIAKNPCWKWSLGLRTFFYIK